ncbi:MAG: cbb3-type cytochrome c oxidase subunit I [Ilumatobacteraceae bacterium]
MAAVPLLLGLAVAVVPLQLGARGLAFGRAAAFGFWTWLLGSALVVASFIGNGGPGGGDSKMVDLFLVSLGITLVGLLVIAGTVATTVLTSRAPGMTLQRVPGLAWASLVGSVALLVTVPVLIADLVLLGVDHKYVRTPGFGANLDLLGWMGWGLSQPATIAYSLIALGVVADVVTTASHRRSTLRPVFLVGVAVAATAVLGAVTQKVQLLEWNGDAGSKIQDLLPWALFHLLPILGPVLVLAVCGQALAAGKIAKVSPAALGFSVLGLALVALGTAAQALTPIVELDLLEFTYEEGAATLILGGAYILAGLGGLIHWAPKAVGSSVALAGATLPLAGLERLAGRPRRPAP